MLVAIISDIHDNLINLKKVLNYCSHHNINKIICCGDAGGWETIDFLRKNFSGEVWFVLGNMDREHLKEEIFSPSFLASSPSWHIFPDVGEGELEGIKFAFTHFPDRARLLAHSRQYQAVFFGHTHKPFLNQQEKTLLLNPGNVANLFYPPSFALVDFPSLQPQLILVNDLPND